MKRRHLTPGQEVVIIYDEIGFVQDTAKFLEYRGIMVGEVQHQIPIFERNGEEITGLDHFWALPQEVSNPDDLHQLQYNLLSLQVKMLELNEEYNYSLPQKIKDPEINRMATNNNERTKSIIQKFGYDPRDESWLERDMANTPRERNWFAFERENPSILAYKWEYIVDSFNQKYNDQIKVEDAKNLSKRRMRYLVGSYNLRISGEKDVRKWMKFAHNCEQKHRGRENRMITWSLNKKGNFPVARTRKPIRFEAGLYFNKCVEKIPYLFTTVDCNWVKAGTPLRVISYDPELKYIKLDFVEEIRNQIREPSDRPWDKDSAEDYDFMLRPEEIETYLEFIDSLV